MRFHVLGLPHTRSTREYAVCAFTTKVRQLCRMLSDRGHEVYHYGVPGADVQCTEHIDVVKEKVFQRVHSTNDWRAGYFILDRDNDCYKQFIRRSIKEISRRSQPGDFLCCTFGQDHQPIAEALPQLIAVESGIGYDHTWAPWRVFESYAWLHFTWGKEQRALNPSWYDCVIPNAFDIDDFPYSPTKHPYHIFLGRPTALKGRQIAIDVCRELGIQLYVAGQGPRDVPEGVTHLGVLGIEERAEWVSHAAALWAPTYYIEPFGGVAVEASLLGTPVICSDMGAFPETVQHGITGWRCRTFDHFMWAARHVGEIQPENCRRWAEANYSLKRVGGMYEEYFNMIAALYDKSPGWYKRNDSRLNLDWLRQTGINETGEMPKAVLTSLRVVGS